LSNPSGSWHFSKPHLSTAVDDWYDREYPSKEKMDAFYDWCLATVDVGPAHGDSVSILDDDTFITYVPTAEVIVTYLAVLQDRSVFIRSIVGLAQ
jgi:hypothetical protein